MVDDGGLARVRRGLAEATGLSLGPQDAGRVRAALRERLDALGLPDAQAYAEHAERMGPLEWRRLARGLTNSETYFFRDEGQFSLLRAYLLPERVAARGREGVLRLWSAGCSTGEEAYSLAMLVDEVLEGAPGWHVRVVGTDLNERALEKARRGVYGGSSFRRMPPGARERHFREVEDGWEVLPRIRRMVTFRVGNLVADAYPEPGGLLSDMDVILCRNVFIYFGRDAVERTARKLADTLVEGGWLLTGHTEILGLVPPGLRARVYPESVAYRREPRAARTDHGVAAPEPAAWTPPAAPGPMAPFVPAPPEPPLPTPPEDPLEAARARMREGAYADALRLAEDALAAGRPGSLALAVRAASNLGRPGRGDDLCREAARRRPLDPEPYYLLAQLAEERGDFDGAREMLGKVLYLDPAHVAAQVEMGWLLEREGEHARARAARERALSLLRARPADDVVEPYGDVRAGELAAHLAALLG